MRIEACNMTRWSYDVDNSTAVQQHCNGFNELRNLDLSSPV